MVWSMPLLGCATLALARGEGTVPEESCATSDWHVPEDEVRVGPLSVLIHISDPARPWTAAAAFLWARQQ